MSVAEMLSVCPLGADLEKTNSMNSEFLLFFRRQIGPFFQQFWILERANKK